MHVGKHIALELLELGKESVVAVAGPLGKRELVAGRADALEELRNREVLVLHRLELSRDGGSIGLLRRESRKERQFLFVEMGQEGRGDFLDRGLEVTELWVVIAVHAADLRGQGLDERERPAEILVVPRDDVGDEPWRGQVAGIVLPFAAPLGDRARQLGKESVYVDLPGFRGRLDALISLAAEVDPVTLEDLGALRVIENDAGDGLLAIEYWIFHAKACCTSRAAPSSPA